MLKNLLKKAGVRFGYSKPSVEDQVQAVLDDFRAPEQITVLAIADLIGHATGDTVTDDFLQANSIDHIPILFVILELARNEVIDIHPEYIEINPIAYDILNHFNIDVVLT